MSVNFKCSTCGKQYAAPESRAGQAIKCSECGELLRIPDSRRAEDASIEYGAPTPSWFLPIVIWLFMSCLGGMSGFVYGHWFRH